MKELCFCLATTLSASLLELYYFGMVEIPHTSYSLAFQVLFLTEVDWCSLWIDINETVTSNEFTFKIEHGTVIG